MEKTTIDFHCPVKIMAGQDVLNQLPFEIGLLGAKRVLLISDQGILGVGLDKIVKEVFQESDVEIVSTFSDIEPDSSIETVQKGAELYQKLQADAMIALGGGSVMDTAKAINILISRQGKDLLDFQGAGKLNQALRPFIAIPTTSGTGSEVTSISVISDKEKGIKIPFVSTYLLPNIAVLDPQITLKLPASITAMTGMDALTHAVEAITGLGKNYLSDAYATSAIKLIRKNLIRTVESGGDSNSRLELSIAATMAGIAFSNSMVGLVHAIGHSLGAVTGLPHGTCMGLLLPYILEFNNDDLSEVSRAMGLKEGQSVIDEINGMKERLNQLVNFPRTLREVENYRPEMNREIAEKAINDGAIIYNRREASREQIIEILELAY